MARGFRALRYAVTIMLAAYLCGFGYFLEALNPASLDAATHTDAVIVLTGGNGRVAAGISALQAGLAGQLFISGVHPTTEIAELARVNGQSSPLFACCVQIGHKAADTIGNAAESAAWMRQHGYGSLRLVTSDYHLPRALLEFRMALPDATVVPNPVRSRSRVRLLPLLLAEYSKYLITLGRYEVSSALGTTG